MTSLANQEQTLLQPSCHNLCHCWHMQTFIAQRLTLLHVLKVSHNKSSQRQISNFYHLTSQPFSLQFRMPLPPFPKSFLIYCAENFAAQYAKNY